jgi:hypothetical protein
VQREKQIIEELNLLNYNTMKLKFVLSVCCLSLSVHLSYSQSEKNETELFLNSTPYEIFIRSANELLAVYEMYDEATLAGINGSTIETLRCSKRCIEINLKISQKYQVLDSFYTMRKIQEGHTSDYSEAWSEEMSKCVCE